jgi:mono/diheme cytochrome c family protein
MKINRNKMLKPLLNGTLAFGMLAGFFSCGKIDENSPGNEFMPDMYRSPSLEVYNYIVTTKGDTIWSSRMPVPGTISYGNMPGLAPTVSYEQSATAKNPLPGLTKNFSKYADEGKELYGKFCVHCHGATGGGDGKVAGKLPGPPPAYNAGLKDLPEGKIYYSITHGKGMMGPHSPLLNETERWKVVCYVQTLQGPKTTAVDSAAVKTPETAGAIK